MPAVAIESLGWVATAIFVASYFCSRAQTLRGVQMIAALLWVAYGLLIGASPVIAANVLVFAAAAWTMTGAARAGSADGVRHGPRP